MLALKILTTLFAFSILFAASHSISAQVDSVKKPSVDCSTIEVVEPPKGTTIISFGVLNGRALHLEKPAFPAAALAVGVRGDVQVSIRIDPRGCVSEANVVSGHPLLASASLNAARKSSFEPITISGNPIWVYGVIVYKYLPKEMNWLELGYHFNNFEMMLELFPTTLPNQRILIENVSSASLEEKQQALDSISSGIIGQGVVDAKSRWLFMFGIWLKEFDRHQSADEKSKRRLSQMLDSVPDGVNPDVTRKARLLHSQTDQEELQKLLQMIKTNMFALGN